MDHLSSGREARWAEGDGLRVSEIEMPASLSLGAHAHEWGQICFVMEGAYLERWSERSERMIAGDLFYRPPGYPHANRFDRGVLTLLVSYAPKRIASLAGDRPGRIPALAAGPLHRELERNLDDAPALEGLAMLLLARAGAESALPAWLAAAESEIRAQLGGPISLPSIAKAVGVHPATLSAGLRRHRGSSFSRYLRRARIRCALDRMSEGCGSLAEIALWCGFADQAHFTRAFRRETGTTPGRWRER